ncbi:MAG: very short patch repair endonuclease [bacterium]
MTDFFSKNKRSWIMRQVCSKDTTPEKTVRSFLHHLGYRYRLHGNKLPGKPDLVFPSRKKVIFVHGCFWHGHNCKRGNRIPKTNTEYWVQKIRRNILRHEIQKKRLTQLGWKYLVVWECQIANNKMLHDRLISFLE